MASNSVFRTPDGNFRFKDGMKMATTLTVIIFFRKSAMKNTTIHQEQAAAPLQSTIYWHARYLEINGDKVSSCLCGTYGTSASRRVNSALFHAEQTRSYFGVTKFFGASINLSSSIHLHLFLLGMPGPGFFFNLCTSFLACLHSIASSLSSSRDNGFWRLSSCQPFRTISTSNSSCFQKRWKSSEKTVIR